MEQGSSISHQSRGSQLTMVGPKYISMEAEGV
jgi:hypothetical protein